MRSLNHMAFKNVQQQKCASIIFYLHNLFLSGYFLIYWQTVQTVSFITKTLHKTQYCYLKNQREIRCYVHNNNTIDDGTGNLFVLNRRSLTKWIWGKHKYKNRRYGILNVHNLLWYLLHTIKIAIYMYISFLKHL